MNNYQFYAGMTSSPFFFLIIAADVVLRGLSLYTSARKDQKIWFVALLLINSLGVLPLVYLLIQKYSGVKVLEVKATPAKKTTKRRK